MEEYVSELKKKLDIARDNEKTLAKLLDSEINKNTKAMEIYEKRTTCEYKKKRFMENKSTSDLMYEILKGDSK